jgi:hypothetical protein
MALAIPISDYNGVRHLIFNSSYDTASTGSHRKA